MELTHGSETSAQYILTPGKYPKEHLQFCVKLVTPSLERWKGPYVYGCQVSGTVVRQKAITADSGTVVRQKAITAGSGFKNLFEL
jgi:hypothetical protein